MKIYFIKLSALALTFTMLQCSLHAFEPQIKLTGRKDLVLSVESRETVLKVGLTYLARDTEDFVPEVEELKDPFTFETPEPVVPVVQDNSEEVAPEPEKVEYDDATVLAAAAASFSKQVRGSLSRGDSSFLQLDGGTLLKPGATFQVRLPKADAFTVTVSEINSQGYTLQVGEATKTLSFESSPQSGSNSVQFTNP